MRYCECVQHVYACAYAQKHACAPITIQTLAGHIHSDTHRRTQIHTLEVRCLTLRCDTQTRTLRRGGASHYDVTHTHRHRHAQEERCFTLRCDTHTHTHTHAQEERCLTLRIDSVDIHVRLTVLPAMPC